MADTWRCSLHRRKLVENLPGTSLLVRIVPALADLLMEAGTLATIGCEELLVSQLEREANKRRRNGPGRLDAGDEIAGDL